MIKLHEVFMSNKEIIESDELFDFLNWLNEIGFSEEKKDCNELLEMTEVIKSGREAVKAVRH